MILPILINPHPTLRETGNAIERFDAGVADLARDMIDTMRAAPGIGLAAHQVGRILQLCVVDTGACQEETAAFGNLLDGRTSFKQPLVLANPKILSRSGARTLQHEGCLSFPGLHLPVLRHDIIEATFQDAKGKPHRLVCSGMLSRCIQHEYDHLQGVLFTDRALEDAEALEF